ncbi:MAG: ABC transporter permease, partial [Deltaproteobacteria bacterium]|nr:ABC transporter permease [Deltaproteobacteria bacterium]
MRMILKDPRSRTILVVPIMVQTLAFGYVATFDLNSVSYALLDQDRTHASRELIALFDGSGVFRRAATLYNSSAIAEVIDKKRALVVLNIGPHFERKLQMGQNAPVQFIVDGRNGNVAGIAASYAVALIDSFNRKRLSALGAAVPAVRISGRAWYNPNMETRWNMISGMVVLLAVIQVLILSSLSVAREKEQGTFDQLLATPFTPMTILLGKALPPVFVGLVQSSLVLPFALFWFGIPFAGSFALLYLGLL